MIPLLFIHLLAVLLLLTINLVIFFIWLLTQYRAVTNVSLMVVSIFNLSALISFVSLLFFAEITLVLNYFFGAANN